MRDRVRRIRNGAARDRCVENERLDRRNPHTCNPLPVTVAWKKGFPLLPIRQPRSCCFIIDTRSEEHTSELQSLMRISYAVFCLKKKTNTQRRPPLPYHTYTVTQ